MSIANNCTIVDCAVDHQTVGFYGQHYRIPKKTHKNPYDKQNYNPELSAWYGMKARCYRESHEYYKDYGGRGIRVCDRWLECYENFIADMGKRPDGKYSLDRINNDGDYEPTNCRWADDYTQQTNKRMHKNNHSGYKGVFYDSVKKKYKAATTVRNVKYHIGYFESAKAASNAYIKVKKELLEKYATI